MFTLNDLNIICGLGWDRPYNSIVDIIFQEQDGVSDTVTVAAHPWIIELKMKPTHTAYLSSSMRFHRKDLVELFHVLQSGYKNISAVLPLDFTREGFTVKHGPGTGKRVEAL